MARLVRLVVKIVRVSFAIRLFVEVQLYLLLFQQLFLVFFIPQIIP